MSQKVEPFLIRVSDAVLNDLRERLARTRFPDEVNDADWSYGTDLSYLRELMEYWRDKFERLYNIQHWTEMPSGGHFAALEEPELLVEDIRRFFRRFRE